MKKIAIHSAPRSGSTWLGSIFDSHPEVVYKLQPLFSYKFKDRLSPTSSKRDIEEFFKELAVTKDDFLDQKEGKSKNIIPEFLKDTPSTIVYKEVRYHHILSNLLQKDNEIKAIGLIRNPLSVILSWLNAPKEFKKELGWNAKEEWRYAPSKNLGKPEEFNGYEKWKEVSKNFIGLSEKYPDRFYIIKYEDLLKSSEKEVEKIMNFCNLTFHESTKEFLKVSQNKNDSDAYSVYKKKKGDEAWKLELPDFIINEILNDPEFKEINKIFKWI